MSTQPFPLLFSSAKSANALVKNTEKGAYQPSLDPYTDLFAHSEMSGTRAGTGESITDALASKKKTAHKRTNQHQGRPTATPKRAKGSQTDTNQDSLFRTWNITVFEIKSPLGP